MPAPENTTESVLDAKMAVELFSIAGSLNSALDLDYLLQKIGAAAEKLLDSEASSIMLLTDDKKSLFFKVAGGAAGAKLKKMTLPIGKGIAGWVAKEGKPEVVNDTTKDSRFAGQFDKKSGFVTKSLACVPMHFRGELVGVVEVLNKREGTYTPEHMELLNSVASLASVAIVNTKIITEQKNFFSHVLELLCQVIGASKPNMEGHPMRAAKLACAIGRVMGMDDYDYRMLYYAGILHDAGYILFNSPAVLSEMGIVKAAEEQHPVMSARMLSGIKMIEGALPMIRYHHERWDGEGFPEKLSGENIPVGARILYVVETAEELRMVGLRGETLHKKALQEVKDGAGTRFDPKVVEAFEQVLEVGQEIW